MTGSGKTAAYSIPLLAKTLTAKRTSAQYAIVLTPTRELSIQVQAMMCELAKYTEINVVLMTGGLNSINQANSVKLKPEFIIGTPD